MCEGKMMGKAVERKTEDSRNDLSKRAGNKHSSRAEKLSPAGSKIVSAFHEAIEAMRSGGPVEKQISVRTYRAEFTCRNYGPEDVHRVRRLLGMSQVLFARFLGVDPNTVRSWEQGARPPSAIARRFMGEIEEDPEYWRRRIARSLVESASTSSNGLQGATE
jgi:DNA-binding transcriptional regulator YiaG